MLKRRTLLQASLTLSLFIGITASVSAQRKSTTDLPVTSRIADAAPDGTPYRIQSDYLYSGAYSNGIESVVSILQSGGDWELNTKISPVRRVYVDFGSAARAGTNAPFQFDWVPARFITKCYLLGERRIRNMTGLNSTLTCPMHVSFDYGGNTYRIEMSDLWSPGTDRALITCTGVVDPNNPATSSCNKWSIKPNGQHEGQSKNLTQLVRIYTSKGKTVLEDRGFFYMTFDITVTNP